MTQRLTQERLAFHRRQAEMYPPNCTDMGVGHNDADWKAFREGRLELLAEIDALLEELAGAEERGRQRALDEMKKP